MNAIDSYDMLEYIRLKLGTAEALTQLAEEAAELAQAALKYRRAITDGNPTPISPKDALDGLIEEMADVIVCWDVIFDYEPKAMKKYYAQKLCRWFERSNK